MQNAAKIRYTYTNFPGDARVDKSDACLSSLLYIYHVIHKSVKLNTTIGIDLHEWTKNRHYANSILLITRYRNITDRSFGYRLMPCFCRAREACCGQTILSICINNSIFLLLSKKVGTLSIGTLYNSNR